MSLYEASPQPARTRDADIIESLVWVTLTLAGVAFLLYNCKEYLEYLVAPAAIVVPLVIGWRLTKFYRDRRHFTKLKTELKKTIKTYSTAKSTTEKLPPGDRELAARQLEAIKKTGWGICKELANYRDELRDRKRSVLTRLGEVTPEELVRKLEPIQVMEVEVEQLLNEFEPIAKARPAKG